MGEVMDNCHTTSCLRMKLGPPERIIPNGDQGDIWYYRATTAGGYVKFWVKNGRVTYWMSRGVEKTTLSTGGWIAYFVVVIGGAVWIGSL